MTLRAVFDEGALLRARNELRRVKKARARAAAPFLPGFAGTTVRIPGDVLVRVHLCTHVGTRLRRVLLAGGR